MTTSGRRPPRLRPSMQGPLVPSPLVVVGVALVWLLGLALAGGPIGALWLAVVAVVAAWVLAGLDPGSLLRVGAVPLLAAVGIGLVNLVLATANADPTAAELVRLGPLRLTEPALEGAVRLATRVVAIVASGVAMIHVSEPTRLADALVWQARVPARFAYGALAAYGAVPRLAADLAILRAMRRARGLRWTWHPRLVVGLLVRAIRHADQQALAMDARGFDSGPRTTYRPMRWGVIDVVVAVGGLVALIVALRLG